MRDHLGMDLNTLNLASLEPDPQAYKFIKTLGKDVMLLAFLDAPPLHYKFIKTLRRVSIV